MTGMNWLCLVIGVVLGAAGQRLLGQRQRQLSRSDTNPPSAPQQGGEQGLPSAITTRDGLPSNGLNPSKGSDEALTLDRREDHPVAEQDVEASLLWVDYVRALERARFQGGFLARAAHELRSPLSSLMGLQQLILTDLCDSPEEERQCVAQSYEAAQNLHRLMDQLIRVAKLEQGSQRLDIQSVNLDTLLEDVESFVHLQVADRNCRLYLPQAAQPVYCRGDYNSLRQVLVMLVEATLSQQASEIRLALESGEAEVKVSLWSDKPFVPMAERQAQLEGGVTWNEDRLAQLKQSLAQEPGASFVPHRLSPGMVMLVSQLMLDLNGGHLSWSEDFLQSIVEAEPVVAETQPETALAEQEGANQGYGLELSLPC